MYGSAFFSTMLKNLIDLLYPLYCQICKKKVSQENFPLCRNCLDKIKPIPEPICQVCGQQSHQPICYRCQESRPFFSQARSVAIYEGVLKEAIQIFKYQKKKKLSKSLGNLLLKSLEKNLTWTKVDYLVPVALTQRRFRERGFNQSELLVRLLSKSLKMKLLTRDLIRKNSPSNQAKANRAKRKENVADAFYVRNPEVFRGKGVLLIDDVFTTGSTANACAKALKEAGAREILVLTLARTC